MAIVILEMDEAFHVAIARALVEAPQCSLVAAANPETREGHLAAADDYEEAVEYAQEFLEKGWRAVVWEVPSRRDSR